MMGTLVNGHRTWVRVLAISYLPLKLGVSSSLWQSALSFLSKRSHPQTGLKYCTLGQSARRGLLSNLSLLRRSGCCHLRPQIEQGE